MYIEPSDYRRVQKTEQQKLYAGIVPMENCCPRIVAPLSLIDFRRLSAYNIHSGLLLYFVEVKDMEYMTVKEASKKWNLSERRLQTICNEGLIPGVLKFGNAWAIPKNAEKPIDRRIKSGKHIKS